MLPVIKKMTEELKVHMYSGGWSGRGAPAAFTYSTGSGQLHAAGVHCMTFLVMAKLCGVDVDTYLFDETFKQFYRFAGHGNVAYGNGLPEGGFRDNGKTSGLALTMAAAAMGMDMPQVCAELVEAALARRTELKHGEPRRTTEAGV